MKCAKCGGSATIYNKAGVPVCSRHTNEKITSPKCPECSSPMSLRESKYGKFWGCTAFPMCDGIQKI
ncbi:MAG: hypothetical protein HN878_01870 [Candidatus Diapherotrites archaeon]|jgi:ssDNA-binding Zn-finger/Zn-ribbon topoisomerase 1|nr:hypothetical protein [Candidatus Diapherotrites archaeon]